MREGDSVEVKSRRGRAVYVEFIEHAVAQQWVPEPVAPHAPLEHWLLPLQVEPAPLWATQEPDTQAFPLVQSELALHALLQIAPPHL